LEGVGNQTKNNRALVALKRRPTPYSLQKHSLEHVKLKKFTANNIKCKK